MNYVDALNAIIDDGIEAAKVDYNQPRNKMKLDGSILGFEECRDKSTLQLIELLSLAQKHSSAAMRNQAHDYWYWRCRTLEIEWVCNVVSCILQNENLPAIVPPTYRGMMKAAEIVGVN